MTLTETTPPAILPRGLAAGSGPTAAARRRRWHPGIALVTAALAVVNAQSALMGHQPLLLGAVGMGVVIGALGYASYCVLPGPPRDPGVIAYLVACFGVLTLLVGGLAINTALPRLGVAQPLARTPLLITVDVLFAVLTVIGRRRWQWLADAPLARPTLGLPSPQLVGRCALLVLPAMAAAGAVALDNGHSGWLTVTMLIAAGLLLIIMAVRASHLSRATICTAIFAVALAMLLMTSLRGRYITGHDVQHEYFVFELAKAQWHWSIGAFRDPYNACLSITLLPTMLASLFHVSDVLIYKFLFQVIFAMVPVGVFLVAERIAGARLAVLAVIVFVAFPTFFSDMPSLNRQEIALLLVVGMTLLIVDRWPGTRWAQQGQLVLLGFGVVLSHYSTSFLMVAQLTVAAVLLSLQRGLGLIRRRLRLAPPGQHRLGVGPGPSSVRILTIPVAVVLAAATVLWQSPITHTGGNATTVLGQVVDSLTGSQSLNARSPDLSASFFGGSPNAQQQLRAYNQQALASRQSNRSYFPPAQVQAYPLHPAPQERSPLTAVGRVVQEAGVSAFGLNSALRGGSAKLIQGLVLLGFLGIRLRRPRRWHLRWDSEYHMLCVGALGVVGALVALPFLTVDYGLLRAFQQALVVLALPAVIGCAALGSLAGRRAGTVAAVALPALFFASSTGVVAAATGGYLPQLHLDNAGLNYDNLYVQDSDQAIASWLNATLPPRSGVDGSLQADVSGGSQLLALTHRDAGSDIIPALVQRNAYVYLSTSNVLRGRAFAQYQDQDVEYDYPLAFLQDNKNRVADTGSARVYR